MSKTEKGQDEKPRQLPARRGFSVSCRGKTLLSRVDPIGQAERAADAAPVMSRTLYFCPSPLYGYGLSRLLSRISGDSAVLCVETDENLMALSLAVPDAPWKDHPSLKLVRTVSAGALCAFLRKTWGGRRFRRVTVLRFSGGWQLAPEVYDSLAAALRQDMAVDWANAMTLVKLGRRFIRNTIRNLPRIPCSRPLSGLRFGNAPALVLGAGPSLDRLLEGLSAAFGGPPGIHERPFRIICVDTALESLKEWGVKPDLAVALESQHWNLRDFAGLGSWEVPVAMDLSALPATGETLGADPRFFATPWAPLRIFDRLEEAGLLPETFPPLGSVGLTAVALARRLCGGPIVLGGLDFAFTDRAFHARGTPGHREGLRHQTRLSGLINAAAAYRMGVVPARAKNGEPVRTDPALRGYRDLFEREFAGESRFRDIAGPGLHLGIRTLPLEEALALLGTVPSPGDAETRNSGEMCEGTYEKMSEETRRDVLQGFIRREREALAELRDILTGAAGTSKDRLEEHLDDADYLWTHFPECAGAEGRRPPAEDISFLKRVRTELDTFIGLWDRAAAELTGGTNRRN
ncbi:MAG: DUF115 domain-containing protein [Treponema sp.]|jgi:hypothetical protein|nr:DUF115 domain-containing protein [Treponema sp.]